MNNTNDARKQPGNSANDSDKRTQKRKLGDLGEKIACTFLMKQGYEILTKNYLKKYGEIDIVALKANIYHFVEVKSVSKNLKDSVIHETQEGYRPEENVHIWKLQRLANTIQVYLAEKKLYDVEWRLDVITVYIDIFHKKAAINLLESIVL